MFSVCVCVFGITVLKIVVERWFWEFKLLIGSLVGLCAWLHSCLCFSLLKKLFLKASSTPPWHLAICRASKFFFLSQSRQILNSWWIDRASLLVSLLHYSTPPWHLHLSKLFFLTPSLTYVSTLLSVENYWGSIYSFLAIWFSFLRSLSTYLHLFLA